MLLALSACSQLTPYRQTTFVPPSSPPLSVGAPLDEGRLALGGWIEGRQTGLEDEVGENGEPAVHASQTSVGGHATLGLARWLDLGVEGQYAHHDWARRSGEGVLAIPGDPPLWAVGGHLTAGWRAEHWGIGGTLRAEYWSLPFARYAYTGPEGYSNAYADGSAGGAYRLEEEGREGGLRLSFATGASLRFGVFDAAAGVAFVPDYSNVGFSQEPQPPWEMSGISLTPTLDVGFLLGPTRLGAQAWFATGAARATNELQSGLGGRLLFELRPRLWGKEALFHEAPI